MFKRSNKISENERLLKRLLCVASECCRYGFLGAGIDVAKTAQNVINDTGL